MKNEFTIINQKDSHTFEATRHDKEAKRPIDLILCNEKMLNLKPRSFVLKKTVTSTTE